MSNEDTPLAHPNYKKTIEYNPEDVRTVSLSNGERIDVVPGTFTEEWVSTRNGSTQLFRFVDLHGGSEDRYVIGQSHHIIAMWTQEVSTE